MRNEVRNRKITATTASSVSNDELVFFGRMQNNFIVAKRKVRNTQETRDTLIPLICTVYWQALWWKTRRTILHRFDSFHSVTCCVHWVGTERERGKFWSAMFTSSNWNEARARRSISFWPCNHWWNWLKQISLVCLLFVWSSRCGCDGKKLSFLCREEKEREKNETKKKREKEKTK